MRKLCLAIGLAFLTGCETTGGLKTEKETMKASKTGDKQELGMFATAAGARVIVANVNEGRFCAEPPPETQTTESSTFKLMMEAAKESGKDSAKIEAFRTFSQGLRQLYKRSHTNQLYRDSSYYLCQAYLNGALTDENLAVFLGMLVDKESTTEKQKEINVQAEALINNLRAKKTNVGSSYLLAQLLLSQWAFESLRHEVDKFYTAESKLNEGKAAAYAEGLDQVLSNVKALEPKLDTITTTTKSTLDKSTSNSEKIEEIGEKIDDLGIKVSANSSAGED